MIEAVGVLRDVFSWSLILAGCGFIFTGAFGVLRMPDFYTRLHAAGLTDTMGSGFLLIGLMLQAGISLASLKLALMLLFIYFTSPIATHALANAAYSAGLRMHPLENGAGEEEEAPSDKP